MEDIPHSSGRHNTELLKALSGFDPAETSWPPPCPMDKIKSALVADLKQEIDRLDRLDGLLAVTDAPNSPASVLLEAAIQWLNTDEARERIEAKWAAEIAKCEEPNNKGSAAAFSWTPVDSSSFDASSFVERIKSQAKDEARTELEREFAALVVQEFKAQQVAELNKATAPKGKRSTTKPDGTEPPGQPLAPQSVKAKRYLIGWNEILDKLGLDDARQEYLRTLNDKHAGPIIITQGAQPKAEEGELVTWWNGLVEIWKAKAEQERDRKATVEDIHGYGREDKSVVPNISGSVKRRPSGRNPR